MNNRKSHRILSAVLAGALCLAATHDHKAEFLLKISLQHR